MNLYHIPSFPPGIHYADPSSMGVVLVLSLPPAESSADVTSTCTDRTGSVQAVLHTQALWQRQLRTVSSKGDRRQQGEPGMAVIFGPGDRLFCRGQSGGTAFKGGLSTA